MLIYGFIGIIVIFDCVDGKLLNVVGLDNMLIVNGICEMVIVGGVNNKIVFDRIDECFVVVGLDKMVIYKNGDFIIDNFGVGNCINKE